MSRPRASDILPRDLWVDHPQGRIFAREWSPPGVGAHRPTSPIVLFHDSLGCVELWRDFPAELSAASGRRVIAYDRLGFGRSDAREVLPELDFIAEEARVYFPAVREQLGLERFVVFGHSVGGGMAVNCAAAFAGACDALITESAQVFPEDLTLSSIAEAKGQFVDESQLQRLARYHGDKARWVLDAWTESWLHPGFAAWSLKSVLPQVRCPVLSRDDRRALRWPGAGGHPAGHLPRAASRAPRGGHRARLRFPRPGAAGRGRVRTLTCARGASARGAERAPRAGRRTMR